VSTENNPSPDNERILPLYRQVLYRLAEQDRQFEAGRTVDLSEHLQWAVREIETGLRTESQQVLDYSARELLADYWNQVSRRINTATTGFRGLNEALSGGIEAERLVILLGAPNTGKTTFAHQMADHIADSGRPVLYVTSEDRPSALVAKTLSRIGGIDYTPVLKGWDTHRVAITAAITRQMDRPSSERLRYLDATNGTDMGTIKERARLHFEHYRDEQHGGGPGVLVVDYLQRVARAVKTRNNLTADLREVVTRVAEELRGLSVELGCGVIAIASQNRGGYTRGESTSLASAKESGDIEYTADVMLALIEDKERKKTSPNLSPIALYIDKNRQGEKGGKIALDFWPARQQFTEVARDD